MMVISSRSHLTSPISVLRLLIARSLSANSCGIARQYGAEIFKEEGATVLYLKEMYRWVNLRTVQSISIDLPGEAP